jgi:uncharacterized RmlC-like cupin family protein
MTQFTDARANAPRDAAPAPVVPAIATDRVSAITPSDRLVLPVRPGQEGFFRETCVEAGQVWAGFAASEPGSANPWHHHGAHTVYVLALGGDGALEFDGPHGPESVSLRLDGTLYVIPPGLVHREVNNGTTKHQVFMFRVGSGPGTLPADAPVGAR